MTGFQFDTIEKLLQAKDYRQLDRSEKELVLKFVREEEYDAMRALYINVNIKVQPEAVTPTADIKKRLDKALLVHKKPSNLFLHHTPLYQSVVASIIFFFVGFGINYFKDNPVRVIQNTTEVIKYVDRPVKQIEYVKVYEKQPALVQEADMKDTDDILNNEGTIHGFSSDISDYMETNQIATINISQMLTETNGISIGSDTLLQKMLTNIY